ncbi:MAG: InlB B-repeat-containing protein, partial [Oscillospiraceae bacterium]|nr:InlB B-repeat-containing protein [Oscillospiraceae bacterium]
AGDGFEIGGANPSWYGEQKHAWQTGSILLPGVGLKNANALDMEFNFGDWGIWRPLFIRGIRVTVNGESAEWGVFGGDPDPVIHDGPLLVSGTNNDSFMKGATHRGVPVLRFGDGARWMNFKFGEFMGFMEKTNTPVKIEIQYDAGLNGRQNWQLAGIGADGDPHTMLVPDQPAPWYTEGSGWRTAAIYEGNVFVNWPYTDKDFFFETNIDLYISYIRVTAGGAAAEWGEKQPEVPQISMNGIAKADYTGPVPLYTGMTPGVAGKADSVQTVLFDGQYAVSFGASDGGGWFIRMKPDSGYIAPDDNFVVVAVEYYLDFGGDANSRFRLNYESLTGGLVSPWYYGPGHGGPLIDWEYDTTGSQREAKRCGNYLAGAWDTMYFVLPDAKISEGFGFEFGGWFNNENDRIYIRSISAYSQKFAADLSYDPPKTDGKGAVGFTGPTVPAAELRDNYGYQLPNTAPNERAAKLTAHNNGFTFKPADGIAIGNPGEYYALSFEYYIPYTDTGNNTRLHWECGGGSTNPNGTLRREGLAEMAAMTWDQWVYYEAPQVIPGEKLKDLTFMKWDGVPDGSDYVFVRRVEVKRVTVGVQKGDLLNLINGEISVSPFYTSGTAAAYSTAMNTAKNVYYNEYATQAEVNSAAAALNGAIAGLVPQDGLYTTIGGAIWKDPVFGSVNGDYSGTFANWNGSVAWRSGPASARRVGLVDAANVLDGVSRLTFEYTFGMGGYGTNTRIFLGLPRAGGFIDVSDNYPSNRIYRTDAYQYFSYPKGVDTFSAGDVLLLSSVDNQYGRVTVTIDDADTSNMMDGCITRFNCWPDSGDFIYLNSIKVYATDDPSKVIGLVFGTERELLSLTELEQYLNNKMDTQLYDNAGGYLSAVSAAQYLYYNRPYDGYSTDSFTQKMVDNAVAAIKSAGGAMTLKPGVYTLKNADFRGMAHIDPAAKYSGFATVWEYSNCWAVRPGSGKYLPLFETGGVLDGVRNVTLEIEYGLDTGASYNSRLYPCYPLSSGWVGASGQTGIGPGSPGFTFGKWNKAAFTFDNFDSANTDAALDHALAAAGSWSGSANDLLYIRSIRIFAAGDPDTEVSIVFGRPAMYDTMLSVDFTQHPPAVINGTYTKDTHADENAPIPGGGTGLRMWHQNDGFNLMPDPGLFPDDALLFVDVEYYWPNATTEGQTRFRVETAPGSSGTTFTVAKDGWSEGINTTLVLDSPAVFQFRGELIAEMVNEYGLSCMFWHSRNHSPGHEYEVPYVEESYFIKSVRVYMDPNPPLYWRELEKYYDQRIDPQYYDNLTGYLEALGTARTMLSNRYNPEYTQAQINALVAEIRAEGARVTVKPGYYTLTNADFKGMNVVDLNTNNRCLGYISEWKGSLCWTIRGGGSALFMPLYEVGNVLDGVKDVKIEVEYAFAPNSNGNTRFFTGYPLSTGFNLIKEPVNIHPNGIVVNNSWIPENCAWDLGLGEWGRAVFTLDDFDNAMVVDDAMEDKINGALINLAHIGCNVPGDALYVRSIRVYAADDPSKEVSIEFIASYYNVVFKDGSQTLHSQQVFRGEAAAAPADPFKYGYVFLGWDKAFDNVTHNLIVNALWDRQAYFPDPAFDAAVRALIGKPAGDIYASELAHITALDVSGLGIYDLTGIEYFAGLETLDCSENNLTGVNLTQNAKLKGVRCENNYLYGLEFNGNPLLEWVYCFNNNLNWLNVYNNPLLKHLDCGDNQLYSLDLTNNINLESLWCQGNRLTYLNISRNLKLRGLNCSNNQLTSLDVTPHTALDDLRCYWNSLTVLDVTQNPALKWIDCASNLLTVLDVTKNPLLIAIRCQNNQLAALDVSQNPELDWLHCDINKITALDITQNPKIWSLSCFDNVLTSLDVSGNPLLSDLRCTYNYMPSEDAITGLNREITVDFKFHPQYSCTVTFMEGSTVLKSESLYYGLPIVPPADPIKIGYAFIGWDKAFGLTNGDLTVNAKWKTNTYTVTFKDGETVLKTQPVDYGGAAAAPADPAKTGYTFDGWDKVFDNITGDLTVN